MNAMKLLRFAVRKILFFFGFCEEGQLLNLIKSCIINGLDGQDEGITNCTFVFFFCFFSVSCGRSQFFFFFF